MHLPDGFINNSLVVSSCVFSVGFVGVSVYKLRKKFLERARKLQLTTPQGEISKSETFHRLSKKGKEKILKMAQLGALVFALQMLNFPIASGTSGHFLGGALLVIVLGPLEAVLTMSLVLIVQALVFADGGVFVLGMNILNMGVIGVFTAYFVYKKFKSIFNAAFLSVLAAAFFCSLELILSGNGGFAVLEGMMKYHFLIGIAEGILTILIIKFLLHEKV